MIASITSGAHDSGMQIPNLKNGKLKIKIAKLSQTKSTFQFERELSRKALTIRQIYTVKGKIDHELWLVIGILDTPRNFHNQHYVLRLVVSPKGRILKIGL